MKARGAVALAFAALLAVTDRVPAAEQAQVPVPRPFPGSGAPPSRPADPPATQPATQPPAAAPAPAAAARPAPVVETPAGLPVYPTAEFIDAYDAGQGQRYYIYGTNAAYADILTYYKALLKNGGRELYRTPPMQQFDLGRFQEDTMAYPPSVVVKDYTWNGSPGYLSVTGTSEKRFKTIIQIVPVTATR
jgi:hypothetical protein